jgi:hypothetical protein
MSHPITKDSLQEIIEQLQTFEIAGGYDTFVDALKRLDPPIQNPSKSLLKKLITLGSAKKCLSCEAVFATTDELTEHIKTCKHFITQAAIGTRKRDLLHRIHRSHEDQTATFQLQNASLIGKLNGSERKAYASLFRTPDEPGGSNIVTYLSPAELATLYNIIYMEIFLIQFRPSKKSQDRSKRPVNTA